MRVPVPPGALSTELELAGSGFLLEPDVDALAAALREAADPAGRAPRAAAARAAAERFPWDRAAAAVRDRLAALQGRTPIRLVAPADVPDRRGTLFAVIPDWSRPDSWVPAVVAYAEAFGPGDDTTLALAASDPDAAGALVERELTAAGVDLAGLADVVLANGLTDPTALELAAAAVVCPNGYRPLRAAAILPPDPSALRALAGAR